MNNNTPPKIRLTYGKEDLYSKSASLVPAFTARWHSFCKYFFTAKSNNKMKQTKSSIKEETTHLHLKKKIPTTTKSRSKATKSQNHLKKEQKTDTPSL
jgi:hypothetical protein